MTEILKTEFEKMREAKYLKICNEYVKLEKENPDASRNRLCNSLAKMFGMTGQGVKNILARHNMFGEKKEN